MFYYIFDDHKCVNFYPLTLTRSVGDLRVGILKQRQRIAAYLNIEKTALIIENRLEPVYRDRHPEWIINHTEAEPICIVNSRVKISDELTEAIRVLGSNEVLVYKEDIIAAKIKAPGGKTSYEDIYDQIKKAKTKRYSFDACWQYPWQMIESNGEWLQKDFDDFFYDKDNYFETEPGVTVLNPYNIWIGEKVEMKPNVVIDASAGPVIIDEGATIMSHSLIIGPAYIGKKSIIKAGAKIYENNSIGPICKIGGEIEGCIVQAYSNKQHDGFLGHSYVGEWVNLGANTNNSDLKNNYSSVKIYNYGINKEVDSGLQFLGALIGDHTKTAINTTIYTGCCLGVGCNLYGTHPFAHHIPSFSWGMQNSFTEYREPDFFQTADKVKKRRNLGLSEEEKELYTNLRSYEMSLSKDSV